MKIIELPDQTLRQKSEIVKFPLSDSDQKIAKLLIKYLNEAEKDSNDLKPGVGISAVQLGYLKRMFYVRVELGESQLFEELLINPEINFPNEKKAALEGGEGCLSVGVKDDRDGLVHRNYQIEVQGYSFLKQKKVKYQLEGFLAIIFQHEYDHLNGILYIDRIDYINPQKPKKHEIVI